MGTALQSLASCLSPEEGPQAASARPGWADGSWAILLACSGWGLGLGHGLSCVGRGLAWL